MLQDLSGGGGSNCYAVKSTVDSMSILDCEINDVNHQKDIMDKRPGDYYL